MRRTTIIFTILLAAGCADFNPDLTGLDTSTGAETGAETGDETGDESGMDSDSATSTSGPDMGSTGDGDGDTETDTGTEGSLCGDDVAEGTEECDGDDLAGASCEDGDFYGGGSVGCTMDCTLDFSACEDLAYEQKFVDGTVPPEAQLLGLVPPQILQGSSTMIGGCFEGPDDHCVQMGPMADDDTSTIRIDLDFAAPGEVRSWVAGYTEKFDVLEVRLNGDLKCEYSENFLAWQECVIAVDAAGVYTLVWSYTKDGSTSEGYDTVWVDSITATNAEPL